MRSLVLLYLVVLLACSVYAQTLSLSQDTFFVNGLADEFEINANGTIYNNTSSPVNAKWRRVMEDIPNGWTGTAICDNNQCYLTHIGVAPVPFTIPANGQSNLDVHFEPAGYPGFGEVLLRAWVVGDSAATVVEGVYKGNAIAVGINSVSADYSKITVYPNPVKDVILVRNLPQQQSSTVEVYNIFGKKLLSFANSVSVAKSTIQRYDLQALPKGIYMIRIYDSFMNVVHTKSISKVD